MTTISVIRLVLVQRNQDLFYLLSGFRVKVSCRFIREEDLRFEDERPGDGHPLLFPAGELPGFVGDPVAQPHLAEDRLRLPFRLRFRDPPDQGGHHGVFQGAEFGQEVVKLEDEADLPVPEGGKLLSPAR